MKQKAAAALRCCDHPKEALDRKDLKFSAKERAMESISIMAELSFNDGSYFCRHGDKKQIYKIDSVS